MIEIQNPLKSAEKKVDAERIWNDITNMLDVYYSTGDPKVGLQVYKRLFDLAKDKVLMTNMNDFHREKAMNVALVLAKEFRRDKMEISYLETRHKMCVNHINDMKKRGLLI